MWNDNETWGVSNLVPIQVGFIIVLTDLCLKRELETIMVRFVTAVWRISV
jgi:hypothetical protein